MNRIDKIFEFNEKSLIELPEEVQTSMAVTSKLMDNLTEGILIEDASGKIAYMNQSLLSRLRYSSRDLIGMDWTALVKGGADEAAPSGMIAPFETVMKTRDGQDLPVAVSRTPVSRGGNVLCMLVIVNDISGPERAEEDRHDPEGYFRSLIENSAEAIVVISGEGRIAYKSPKAREILQLGLGGAEEREVFDNIHPEDLATGMKLFEGLVQNPGGTVLGEARVRHKDGTWRWIKATGTNLIHDPTVQGIVVNFDDITSRVLAESALRESEERLYLLMQHAPFGIQVFDMDGTLAQVNKAWENMWGARGEEVVGKYNALKDPQLEKLGLRPLIERAFSGESQPIPDTLYVPSASNVPGEARWVRASYYFIHDRIGQPRHLVLLNEDVTERQRAENALTESEQNLRLLTETASDVIVRINSRSEIVSVNSAVERVFGHSSEQLIGRDITTLMPEQLQASHRAALARYVSSREKTINWAGIELTGLHKTGRDFPVEVSFGEHESGGELFFTGIIRDISERKQAQRHLQESEERFRSLIENLSDVITVIDGNGIIEYESPSVERVLGYKPEELIGRNVFEFIHPDDLPEVMEVIGRVFPTPGVSAKAELRFMHKDGSWSYIESIGMSAQDGAGRRTGIITSRDITERKQAGERIQVQLQQLNALRTIDLAISSSFDLQMTLNIILDQVVAHLEVDTADILLFNPGMQVLEYAAARGFLSNEIRHSRLRMGEGLAGRAIIERRTVHVPDLNDSSVTIVRTDILKQEKFVSYFGVPLMAKGRVIGTLEVFHRTHLRPGQEWLNFLDTIAGQAAIAIDNAKLFEDLQRTNLELLLAYDVTIEGWSHAMDLRDKETEGHTRRVTEMTVKLARSMGFRDADLTHLRRGALLHDIGKLGVPDSILLKPGALTDEEWVIMKYHTEHAFKMLSPIVYLRPAIDIPYCHHENWDGTGYPRGLKGEQIPLAARIFAVVDVWDALTSDRPYRKAWTKEATIEYIKEQSGRHFDPQVVEAFLTMEELA